MHDEMMPLILLVKEENMSLRGTVVDSCDRYVYTAQDTTHTEGHHR